MQAGRAGIGGMPRAVGKLENAQLGPSQLNGGSVVDITGPLSPVKPNCQEVALPPPLLLLPLVCFCRAKRGFCGGVRIVQCEQLVQCRQEFRRIPWASTEVQVLCTAAQAPVWHARRAIKNAKHRVLPMRRNLRPELIHLHRPRPPHAAVGPGLSTPVSAGALRSRLAGASCMRKNARAQWRMATSQCAFAAKASCGFWGVGFAHYPRIKNRALIATALQCHAPDDHKTQ